MKEIKFRAWDKVNKFMVVIFDNTKNTEWYLPNLKEQYEIMQFTGLHDKNGKELYEGDIVLYASTRYTVSWIPEICAFEMTGHNRSIVLNKSNEHTREIIGNIYENPDLANK